MKKFVSLVLTMCLILSVFSSSVLAAESENAMPEFRIHSGEDAIVVACEIWPEYADKLQADSVPQNMRSFASDGNQVVVTKTHQISENESIQYIERADGFAFVVARSNWLWTVDETTHWSTYDEYRGNIYVASGMSTAHLLNFKYRIYHNDYDRIMDKGYMSTTRASVFDHNFQAVETANSAAYYTYQVYFLTEENIVMGSSIVNLRLQNNEFTALAS